MSKWEVFGASEARFQGDYSHPEYNELCPPADGKTPDSGWPYIVAGPDMGLGYGRMEIASGIQSLSDAKLIAAAPMLRDALKGLLGSVDMTAEEYQVVLSAAGAALALLEAET